MAAGGGTIGGNTIVFPIDIELFVMDCAAIPRARGEVDMIPFTQ